MACNIWFFRNNKHFVFEERNGNYAGFCTFNDLISLLILLNAVAVNAISFIYMFRYDTWHFSEPEKIYNKWKKTVIKIAVYVIIKNNDLELNSY